ncbi:MAG: hypothetical protein AABZ45_08330 [Pseudomonadota bacterium]
MMMTQTPTVSNTAKKRALVRQQLLCCGAMAICLGVLAVHAPAAAQSTSGQSFQGSPSVVVPGSATVVQTATLDTITVTAPQAVINWTPDDRNGTGTIDFLPVGKNARFTGLQDFTVLNRIIPLDGNDIPIARMIALNGTITSDINGQQPGGNVWFYSPGGILVGSTGVINVGSLVLSSRDIDTTGGLFGLNGEIRFRDPNLAGTDTARIEIANGASITALNDISGSSYIALVAPRIVQAGTINVEGSVALVAAEQADIRINNGLFDINVLVGSSDSNGIVHTGTTGGPSDTSVDYESRAYFVAVPKNQAMTMLLSGTFGFETVSTVTLSEGGIVLSAGYNVANGTASTAANGNTSASIQIGNATFRNELNADATDSITGRPDFGASGPLGQIQFRKDAALRAANAVDFSVGMSQSIIAGGNLTLRAGSPGVGGTVRLGIDSTPPPVGFPAVGGTIGVVSQLLLDANATGITSVNNGAATAGTATIDVTSGQLTAGSILARANGTGGTTAAIIGAAGRGGTTTVTINGVGTVSTSSLTLEANGGSAPLIAFGGDGIGGSASVQVNDGTLAVSNTLSISALGVGQVGSNLSGHGTGGMAALRNSDGTINAATTVLDASGFGGGILDQLANPLTPNTVAGGNGTGGGVTFESGGGSATLGALSLTANGIGGESRPTSDRTDARGGSGQGGTITATIFRGAITVTNATLSANAHGGSSGGMLGTTGAATGGTIDLNNLGGFFQVGTTPLVDGNLTISANANVDAQDGGTVANIQGGTISIASSFDSGITINNQLDLQATAIAGGGPLAPPVVASGTAIGGAINLSTNAGILTADTARIDVSALAANATGTAGNAFGGNISLTSLGGGNISFNQLNSFDANGTGGNGAVGGTGTGGAVSIRAEDGSINLGGRNFINANGVAGMSAAANPSKTGTGGTLTIESTDESGSQFTFGELYAAVNGGTALPLFSSGSPLTATHGVGGSATITLNAPNTVGTLLSIVANGYGANGGNGTGGTIMFGQSAGSTDVTFLTLGADGFGGSGVENGTIGGGDGQGGQVTTNFIGGRFDADNVYLTTRGEGGSGGGSGFVVTHPTGNGGSGTGGQIVVLIDGPKDSSALLSIASSLNADAGALGGEGGDTSLFGSAAYFTAGDGGTAEGGAVTLTHRGNILSDGADGPAAINLSARAHGGAGGDFNFDVSTLPTDSDHPDGGMAIGGTVDVILETPARQDEGGAYSLDSSAFGGVGGGSDGGESPTGGNGGLGMGGTSRLTVSNVDVGAVQILLRSEGYGGDGTDGLNGKGGTGGVGGGGTASVRVNGLDGAITLLGSAFSADGHGGRGGNGFVSPNSAVLPINGYDGGNGGDGTGGLIELETNDGTLTIADDSGQGAALFSHGFGGNAGRGADNDAGPANIARFGGNAGFGGVGIGGTVNLRTNGGTITTGNVNQPPPALTIDVGGIGGAGAMGGIGNIITIFDTQTGLPISSSGGAGFSTGETYNQAGLIRLEANDSADQFGTIDLADTFLLANGDFAGRIELIENSDDFGLAFGGLTAEARGSSFNSSDFTLSGSGIYLRSQSGAIRSGTTSLTTDGIVQIDADNDGGLVSGALDIAADSLVARHINAGVNDRTVTADSITANAQTSIDLQAGTRIDASSSIFMSAGTTINFDRVNSEFDGIQLVAGTDVDGNALFAAGTITIDAGGNVTLVSAETDPNLNQNTAFGGGAQGSQATSTQSDILITAGGDVALGELIAADRIHIIAATLNGANSSLRAGDDIEIDTASNAQFGTLDANDGIDVAAGGAITGARATTLLGTAGIALNGTDGVAVTTVASRGTTALTATNGAVQIDALTSAGLVTANGRSATITGSGGLTFSALGATAGDASVTATSGNLTVQSGTVSGTATLTTRGGALTAQNLSGNRVVLSSNTTARIVGTVSSATELVATSTGATIVDGVATGGTVRITSGDIVIGTSGRIGTAGTTSLVDLTNGDSSTQTYIGGADQANAYSLSAAEMLRVFGTNVIIRAPRVSAQGSATLGSTRPPDVVIGAFTFSGASASTGNLGANGTLSIITPGAVRVVGAVGLSNMASGNGFSILADESIEVILGQGSIRLTGSGAGGLGGRLTLVSEDIAVATMSAIADIAAASDIASINTRLGANDGITSDDGALAADSITLDVLNGVFIQNSGTNDQFSNRRGFTANSLNISTEGSNTSIVINGRIANAAGTFATGKDTIPLTMINGQVAGAGGLFTPGSTINGCSIANAAGCNRSFDFDQRDIIHNALSSRRGRAILRNLILLGLGRTSIHLRDADPLTDEPLLDEPITGAGNDDLWTAPTGE